MQIVIFWSDHFTEVEYSRIHVLADLGQVHGEDASLKLIQISFTEREEYWEGQREGSRL